MAWRIGFAWTLMIVLVGAASAVELQTGDILATRHTGASEPGAVLKINHLTGESTWIKNGVDRTSECAAPNVPYPCCTGDGTGDGSRLRGRPQLAALRPAPGGSKRVLVHSTCKRALTVSDSDSEKSLSYLKLLWPWRTLRFPRPYHTVKRSIYL